MKKFLSVMLAAIMLAAMFTFSVSASWSEAGYTVVIGDSVHFRYGPGTDYDIVQTVAPATYGDRLGTIMSDKVSRDSSGREWFSTPYGWICMDYVTTYLSAASISSGTVINISSSLAVRKGPTTSAPSIGSLSNGTAVTVLAETHFQKRSLLVHDLLRLRRGMGSCRVHKGELSRNVRYSVRNGGFGTGGAFRSRGSRFGKMNRPLSRKICGGSVRWALPPYALLKNPPL